jgi:hypothetical protein
MGSEEDRAMKERHMEAQIAFALRQAVSDTLVSDITRKMVVTDVTFYRWKKLFADGRWILVPPNKLTSPPSR